MSETKCIRPILGFEGYFADSRGCIYKNVNGNLRKKQTSVHSSGYEVATVTANGRKQQCKVHRLILLAFCGPPPGSCEACHNNGNRLDNRIANLRWDTKANNQRDRIAHGTANIGERNGRAKLSQEEARRIRYLYQSISQRKLATRFGVSKRTIAKIVNNLSFTTRTK